MNEVNEKRSGSSEASACSAADGTQLTKIGWRSADELQLALASAKGRQKKARQFFDEACDEYHAASVKYEKAKATLLEACDETDSVSELIAKNKHSVTEGP